jgi:hypothetical protein
MADNCNAYLPKDGQWTGVLLLGSASHRIASHLVQAVDAREHTLEVFHHAWQHTVHRKLDLALSVYCGRNQNAFLTARRHGGGESKLGVRLLAVPSALSFLPRDRVVPSMQLASDRVTNVQKLQNQWR